MREMKKCGSRKPLSPEELAANNREVALYYRLTKTLSRNLICTPDQAMRLLELPGSTRKQISARLANETKKPEK